MATWLDMTIRVGSDIEVEVNPETGEIECSWTIDEAPGSRITLLVPREIADRASVRTRDLLMLLPPMAAIVVGVLP